MTLNWYRACKPVSVAKCSKAILGLPVSGVQTFRVDLCVFEVKGENEAWLPSPAKELRCPLSPLREGGRHPLAEIS